MANVNDYVKYYRNKTFMEVPFNEVDALIFASLSYINLDGFTNNLPQSINAVATKYFDFIVIAPNCVSSSTTF